MPIDDDVLKSINESINTILEVELLKSINDRLLYVMWYLGFINTAVWMTAIHILLD